MVDVLILGATGMLQVTLRLKYTHRFPGFTGRLITRYLHVHRERDSFSLGVAGRSKTKLKELSDDLDLEDSVKVFTVDVTKEDELDNLISQTKVVINTVGPFLKWSKPVVQ